MLMLLALGVGIWTFSTRLASSIQPKYQLLKTDPGQSDDQNDERVLAKLRANGSDLTKPTDVVFYLYVPALRDAKMAAATLKRAGYSVEVQPPLGRLADGTYDASFSVVAHLQEIPSLANLRKNRTAYKALAHRYHGDYDGWEAALSQ